MAATMPTLRLAPEDDSDKIIVSKKGLAELKRRADQAEARERENERLRGEGERLRKENA